MYYVVKVNNLTKDTIKYYRSLGEHNHQGDTKSIFSAKKYKSYKAALKRIDIYIYNDKKHRSESNTGVLKCKDEYIDDCKYKYKIITIKENE